MKTKKVENRNINETEYVEFHKTSKFPAGVLILILKFWAAAAAVFFGTMDSCMFELSATDDEMANLRFTFVLIVFIALMLTLIMNYAIRPIVSMMHNRRNNCFKYHMVNLKGFKSFLISFPYYFALSVMLYHITVFLGEHNLVLNPFGNTGFGIEPFTYALCFMLLDSTFIIIKNIIMMAYQRYKYFKQINND